MVKPATISNRQEEDMPLWIVAIQWLSRSVLGLLLILSLWSVATMLRCARTMKIASGSLENSSDPTQDDLNKISTWIEKRQWDSYQEWASKKETLQAGTSRVLLQNLSAEASQVDRAVRSYLSLQRTRLEQGLTILATLGSNAPFIGLFGTVLGIIQAFGALGAHQNNTSDIMVGISEALVATAIGLFVAIPAVIAFNVFSRKLRVLLVNAEALKDLYLSKTQLKTQGN
jgi:biopolymer transport protein ExbB